jgi:cytoskeletal protein CcmA (bactofilin family)
MKAIENITTYIGKDTEFEGKLRFYGTIRIDGHFRGEITGEGTLIVGEGAIIESDIHVSLIFNSGRIQGDVTADNKIEIRAPGKILGNIQAPSIVINEGATIEGNCRRGNWPWLLLMNQRLLYLLLRAPNRRLPQEQVTIPIINGS